ncbi:MAG: hypothetical protein GY754_24795 [bacterium]|nr:hypothetical protein [bacterium]
MKYRRKPMLQTIQENQHFNSTQQPVLKQKTITIDEIEKEALEAIIKEILLNLPIDPDAGDELYRSDIKEDQDHFQLFLFFTIFLRKKFPFSML